MPRPTEPVKRICYADDITVWVSGVKIPELAHKINDDLTEMSCFLRDNSLSISAPKSTVTLFTPDPKQPNTHPKIKISDAELHLVRNPKLLGVYLDTFFSFLILIAFKWPTEFHKVASFHPHDLTFTLQTYQNPVHRFRSP